MNRPGESHSGYSLARSLVSFAWMLALVAALAAFMLRDPGSLRAALSLFSPGVILSAALLVLLAKVLLAELFGLIARSQGLRLTTYERQRAYHLSQLAKYLPGLIWQFASKGYLLRRSGARPAAAARVIALEQSWIIGSAVVIGLTATSAALPSVISAERLGPSAANPRAAAGALAASAILGAGLLLRRSGWEAWRGAAVLSLVAWLALSLGFAVLVGSIAGWDAGSVLAGSAVFPIAYIGGYIAPFAPGGIGVREGLLAALLSPMLRTEAAVAVAVMSRLVYLGVEVVLSVALLRAPRV